MANQPQIQYIHQFYTAGSEAQKVAPAHAPRRSRTTLPKVAPSEKLRVQVDPVALGGVVVAVAMLVLMIVGMVQYSRICEQYAVMENYVMQLREENALMNQQYASGYDLEDVAATARSLGMIPVEEAQTISIRVQVPVREPEPTFVDNIIWFLSRLFA